jgi:hypothetical protein
LRANRNYGSVVVAAERPRRSHAVETAGAWRSPEAGPSFSEPQTAACVAGTVTFTRYGADLAYRWTDNIEQNVATLHKQ